MLAISPVDRLPAGHLVNIAATPCLATDARINDGPNDNKTERVRQLQTAVAESRGWIVELIKYTCVRARGSETFTAHIQYLYTAVMVRDFGLIIRPISHQLACISVLVLVLRLWSWPLNVIWRLHSCVKNLHKLPLSDRIYFKIGCWTLQQLTLFGSR